MRDTLLVIDDSELDLAILNEIFKHLFRVECSSDPRVWSAGERALPCSISSRATWTRRGCR